MREIKLKGHAPVANRKYVCAWRFNESGRNAGGVELDERVHAACSPTSLKRCKVEGISLRVESVAGRQSYSIESAWLEKGEAAPGETLRLRVLVRPYRGTARIEETTIRCRTRWHEERHCV